MLLKSKEASAPYIYLVQVQTHTHTQKKTTFPVLNEFTINVRYFRQKMIVLNSEESAGPMMQTSQ